MTHGFIKLTKIRSYLSSDFFSYQHKIVTYEHAFVNEL